MTRPLNVLVVTPKAFLGGAERWLLSIMGATDRLTPSFICLDADGPLPDELRARGFPVTVLPTGPTPADLAEASVALFGQIREQQPDAVLANGIKSATASLPACRLLGVPGVWARHDSAFEGSLGVAAFRLADLVVGVTPITTPGQFPANYRHLPPPIGAEPQDVDAARAELTALGVPDDELLRLGMFSRLVRHKGIDRAIEALAQPGGEGWHLVVAGLADPAAPDEERFLRELVVRLDVQDRVSFVGEVPDTAGIVAGVDAVAALTRGGVPGYPDSESYGMTVIEALAAGVPVIGDPTVVPAMAVAEHRAATVPVDAQDAASVARGLSLLADDRERGMRAAAAGQVGASLPRAAQIADAVASMLADVCHRPGAGLPGGPPFSVVATVWNEGENAAHLVRSLQTQIREGDEIVIVDGGSTDDTMTHLAALEVGGLVLVEAPGAGISEGRNIGVRAASNDWIACTDAGCDPAPGWLDALRAAAAEGSSDLVTGVYEAASSPDRPWEIALAAVAYPTPSELRRQTPLVKAYGRLFGRVYDAALPTGRSVGFSRTAWEGAGGYPEDLATAEDVLFGKRAVEAGARAVLSADAMVLWDQRPTLAANLRMFEGYGRGDGQSGDTTLVVRDLIRAGAYAALPFALAVKRLRPVVLAGALAYQSLPLSRTLRGPRPMAASALVPVMTALRDLSKAKGCLEGMLQARRRGDA